MARIERNCQGCTEIHVSKTQNEVFGVEHGIADFVHGVETVDAADELDVGREPGRVVAHTAAVPRQRLGDRRIVEREGEPDRAAGYHEIVGRRQLGFEILEHAEQSELGEDVGVEVDVQRPHTGRDVDDAGNLRRGQCFGQCVDAHTQAEVEGHLAVFDEDVVVAAAKVRHLGSVEHRVEVAEASGVEGGARHHRRYVERSVGTVAEGGCVLVRHRHEPNGVAGADLAELPPMSRHHGQWARESAEARAVGTEQDRCITRDIE